MTPRSQEFLSEARDALRAAHLLLREQLHARAVSDAYYAMLYAARAALSEEDRNARTHRGTWALFRETFVETRRFDGELFAAAQSAQRAREAADYDAAGAPAAQAREIVDQAERFLEAIVAMLGDGH